MSERAYRWLCVAMLSLATLAICVAAVRWLVAPDATSVLARVGRPLLVTGIVLPQVAFCVAQALPGGRRAVPLAGVGPDAWGFVLVLALLAAVLGAFTAGPDGEPDAVSMLPYILVSGGLSVARTFQLRRGNGVTP